MTKMHGVGIDIVDVERIARVLKLYPQKFPQRILHPEELAHYQQQKKPAAYLARCFAAKEAISKALGKGFRKTCYPRQLLIEHDALGKPSVTLTDHPTIHVEISLADEKRYATAFAIAISS